MKKLVKEERGQFWLLLERGCQTDIELEAAWLRLEDE